MNQCTLKVCGICMELKPSCPDLQHNVDDHISFCEQCLRSHVGAMLDNNVSEFRCPEITCSEVLQPDFIMRLLDIQPALQRRFEAKLVRQALAALPHLFYCPCEGCPNVVWLPRRLKPYRFVNNFLVRWFTGKPLYKCSSDGCDKRRFDCSVCRQRWCCLCNRQWNIGGVSHAGRSCLSFQAVDYDKQIALNEQWKRLNRGQDCPKCGVWIVKESGCPAMKCSACSHSFCWKCEGTICDHYHISPVKALICAMKL